MSESSLPYDPQAIGLATDEELVYRTRSLAVRWLRTRFRGRYLARVGLEQELAYCEGLCGTRGLQPYDGGWFELTSPSQLGRWL